MKAFADVVRAIEVNDTARLKSLLEMAPTVVTSSGQLDGRALLHVAAATSNATATYELLLHGAPCDAPDKNGCLPIHLAAQAGSAPVLEFLLQAPGGQDLVNSTNREGLTALHFAALNGHKDVVRLLLNTGARPDLRDTAGFLPVDLVKPGNVELLDLLQQVTADAGAQLVPVDGPGTTALVAKMRHQVDAISSEIKSADREIKDAVNKLGDHHGSVKDLFAKVNKLDTWFKAQLEIIPEWQKALSSLQGMRRNGEDVESRMKLCEAQLNNFLAEFSRAQKTVFEATQVHELAARELPKMQEEAKELVDGVSSAKIAAATGKLARMEERVQKAADDLRERLIFLEDDFHHRMSSKYLQEDTLKAFMENTSICLDSHEGDIKKLTKQLENLQEYRDILAQLAAELVSFKEEASVQLRHQSEVLDKLPDEVQALATHVKKVVDELGLVKDGLKAEAERQGDIISNLGPKVKDIEDRTLVLQQKTAVLEVQAQAFNQSIAVYGERHEKLLEPLQPKVSSLEHQSLLHGDQLRQIEGEVRHIKIDFADQSAAVKQEQKEGQERLAAAIAGARSEADDHIRSLEAKVTKKLTSAKDSVDRKADRFAEDVDQKVLGAESEVYALSQVLDKGLVSAVNTLRTDGLARLAGLEKAGEDKAVNLQTDVLHRVQEVEDRIKQQVAALEAELMEEVQALGFEAERGILHMAKDLNEKIESLDDGVREALEEAQKKLAGLMDTRAFEVGDILRSSAQERLDGIEEFAVDGLNAHDEQLKDLEPRVDHLKQGLDHATPRVEAQGKQINKLLTESLPKAKRRLVSQGEEIEKVQKKVDGQGKELAELEKGTKLGGQAVTTNNTMLGDLEGRTTHLEDSAEDQGKKLETHKLQLERVEDMLAQNEAYKQGLEGRLAAYTSHLDHLTPAIASLTASQVQSREELQQQRGQLDKLVPDVTTLAATTRHAVKEAEQQKAQLKELAPEVQMLEVQHKASKGTLSNHTSTLQRLTPAVANIKAVIKESASSAKGHAVTLDSLTPQVAEMEVAVHDIKASGVKEEVSRLVLTVEDATSDVLDLKEDLGALTEAMEEGRELINQVVPATQAKLGDHGDRLVMLEGLSATHFSRLQRLSEDMEAFREETLEPFLRDTSAFLQEHSNELANLNHEVTDNKTQIAEHQEKLANLKDRIAEVNRLLSSYYVLIEPQVAGNAKDLEEHRNKLQKLGFQFAGIEDLIRGLLINNLTPDPEELEKLSLTLPEPGKPVPGREGLVSVALAVIKLQAKVSELSNRMAQGGGGPSSSSWRRSQAGLGSGGSELVEELEGQRRSQKLAMKELQSLREKNQAVVAELKKHRADYFEQEKAVKAARDKVSEVPSMPPKLAELDEVLAELPREISRTQPSAPVKRMRKRMQNCQEEATKKLDELEAEALVLKSQNHNLMEALVVMQQMLVGTMDQQMQTHGTLKSMQDVVDTLVKPLVCE